MAYVSIAVGLNSNNGGVKAIGVKIKISQKQT
jgi:hypothetical protein